MMTNRLAPLTAPFPKDVQAILAVYPQTNGYVLSLFRTFANSLRFLKKGVPNLLDKGSPLNLRTREIIILRVTANRNCAYEWGVHVSIFSKAAGLTTDQIAGTCLAKAECWDTQEQALIEIVDQLCVNASLPDDLQDAFQ